MNIESHESDRPKPLQVDDERHVNEATLKLLQFELESKVRDNFFKTVTLPIGIGGVIGIFVAIFLWIPQRVDGLLKQPDVQALLTKSVNEEIDAYFRHESTQLLIKDEINRQIVQRIRSEVDSRVAEQLKESLPELLDKRIPDLVDRRVTVYFDEHQDELRYEIEHAVENQFTKKSTADLLAGLVNDYLKTTGKSILVERINEILAPAVARMTQSVHENQYQAISQRSLESFFGEQKGNRIDLREFIGSDAVEEIRADHKPLVMTMTVRRQNTYAADVIEDYLQALRETFPQQFHFVALSFWDVANENERLVALIPQDQFGECLEKRGRQLQSLLNSASGSPPIAPDELHETIAEWFGANVTRRIPEDGLVRPTLEDANLWPDANKLDEYVAVVDKNGSLTFVTSRRKIIEGLLIADN